MDHDFYQEHRDAERACFIDYLIEGMELMSNRALVALLMPTMLGWTKEALIQLILDEVTEDEIARAIQEYKM